MLCKSFLLIKGSNGIGIGDKKTGNSGYYSIGITGGLRYLLNSKFNGAESFTKFAVTTNNPDPRHGKDSVSSVGRSPDPWHSPNLGDSPDPRHRQDRISSFSRFINYNSNAHYNK